MRPQEEGANLPPHPARQLLAPVAVLVAVLVVVPRLADQGEPGAGPAVETPAAPQAGPLTTPAQAAALGELWTAWAVDLGGEPAALPPAIDALPFEEAVCVLLAVRGAQVALAASCAPVAADLGEVLREAGLGPEPVGVEVRRVAGADGCVAVLASAEPYGRTFYGRVGGEPEPGPVPGSPLEEVLLRTSRVGLGPVDARPCGGAVAFSPAAQQALEELRPLLLP